MTTIFSSQSGALPKDFLGEMGREKNIQQGLIQKLRNSGVHVAL